MATAIIFNLPNNDETRPIIQTQVEHSFVQSNTKHFQALPSIHVPTRDKHQQASFLSVSYSTSDVLNVEQSLLKSMGKSYPERTTNENVDHTSQYMQLTLAKQRSPSELRVALYPDEDVNIYENLTHSQIEVSKTSPTSLSTDLRCSDPTLLDGKTAKVNRLDFLRRTLLDHRLTRRTQSSFSSSINLRSLTRRRSTQNLTARSQLVSCTRQRRHVNHLSRHSKWHIVRRRLHDIAMMSESYARLRSADQDLRWINLREKIRSQVMDMREMSLLRQQDDGLVAKKKSFKTKFDLKTIPMNEVLHVERDGRVYSMSTRDLVLGRLLSDEDIQLDTFAQLDARRQFQVQQKLLRQQEGRTRLKKNIAFSFCLCNLSFIALMAASMFVFAMKTILELRSRHFY
jgi:hypothetical protein